MSESDVGDGGKGGEQKIFDTVTVAELRELMTLKGTEAVEHIYGGYGGVRGLCGLLSSSPENGLGGEEAISSNRRRYGANVVPPRPAKSFLALSWEALQDVTLTILILCALVSI